MPVQTRGSNKRHLPPTATAGMLPCKKNRAGSRNAETGNVSAANAPPSATEPEASVTELAVQLTEQGAPSTEPEAPSNEPENPMSETEAPTIAADALPIVTGAQLIVAEAPLVEEANGNELPTFGAGNIDPPFEGETIEDHVEAPQNVVETFCANDIFAEITIKTSASVFANILKDTLSQMHMNFVPWLTFAISVDKVVKAYNCALAKNIARHFEESIAAKMHSLFVARFFARHGIANAAVDDEEDEDEAVASIFEAELRGKVSNAYQSAIDEATTVEAFRAAIAEYVATFQDVFRPPKYKMYELVIALRTASANDVRVVEVAGLMRQNVTESARLHRIGTEMARLIKEGVESEGLEVSLREIRDAMVADLEGKSTKQMEGFVGAFQKMAAPFVNWMRMK